MTALLECRELTAGYDEVPVLRDLNIEVNAGEVVALLGPNGAGKTTTLLALTGALPVASGQVSFDGETHRRPLHWRARRGLSFVPEERSVFSRLTARQNLAIGRGTDAERALSIFPELRELQDRPGGLLSGGEQQMLTLARALSRGARLLMADELSLGLAPRTVGRLLDAVRAAADEGMGALLVEQHVHRVLDIADRVYVLRQGRVQFAGSAQKAKQQIDTIQEHYLRASPSTQPAEPAGSSIEPSTAPASQPEDG